jgi:O-antigen ligase
VTAAPRADGDRRMLAASPSGQATASHTPGLAARGYEESALLWLWLCPASLAPVWFGSNMPLVWGVHAVVFGMALAAYGASSASRPLPVPLRRLAVPLIALAVVLGWAAIQTVPWTPATWRQPIWAMAATVVGTDLLGAISVYPAAGWVAILWAATAAAVFLLAVQFGRDPRRAHTILCVVAVTGALIAAYGLVVYATGNHTVLWVRKRYYPDRLAATFIDPDHFAAYGGVVMVCILGLAADAARRRAAAGSRLALACCLMLWGFGFCVVGAAVLPTGSRAGVAAAGLGLTVLWLLLLARGKAGRRAAIALMAFSGLVLVGLWPEFGHRIAVRLPNFGLDTAGRLALDARVLAAIRQSSWLGYGFGAFEQAFAMFRDSSLPAHNRIEYAHNDWLEALMTLGIPVGLMLWLICGWMLARCLRGALRRGQETVYPAIGAAAGVLAAAHSLIDFDMQIQGFAFPLLTVLGVGVAQSWAAERQTPAAVGS